jgi:hypothetical protein
MCFFYKLSLSLFPPGFLRNFQYENVLYVYCVSATIKYGWFHIGSVANGVKKIDMSPKSGSSVSVTSCCAYYGSMSTRIYCIEIVLSSFFLHCAFDWHLIVFNSWTLCMSYAWHPRLILGLSFMSRPLDQLVSQFSTQLYRTRNRNISTVVGIIAPPPPPRPTLRVERLKELAVEG